RLRRIAWSPSVALDLPRRREPRQDALYVIPPHAAEPVPVHAFDEDAALMRPLEPRWARPRPDREQLAPEDGAAWGSGPFAHAMAARSGNGAAGRVTRRTSPGLWARPARAEP